MRSVVVVLPASMCAMMPMLRVSLSEPCLAMTLPVFPWHLGGPSRTGPRCAVSARSERPTEATRRRCSRLRYVVYACARLPAVVRECLVRLRHAVRVFLLLHGASAALVRVHQL